MKSETDGGGYEVIMLRRISSSKQSSLSENCKYIEDRFEYNPVPPEKTLITVYVLLFIRRVDDDHLIILFVGA